MLSGTAGAVNIGGMTDVLVVYVTAPTHACAVELAHAAVDARLAACANICPSVTSVYRWNDAVKQADEVILFLKTRAEHFEQLEKLLISKHPYDCPCVLAWTADKGSLPYLSWINDSLKKDA